MKKKLVVGITIIVCLLFSLFIMGIFLVNQDEKSLNQKLFFINSPNRVYACRYLLYFFFFKKKKLKYNKFNITEEEIL